MWSGPRNLSTAMMRSFGSRADTACIDEPFYAAYLDKTDTDHPLRAETLARHERDAEKVAEDLVNGHRDAEIFYQKHMTQHMVEGIPREWMAHVTNVFLIRHPARVLASFAKKMSKVTLDDIGFVQQTDLCNEVRDLTGKPPIVIDTDDILADPKQALTALCEAIDIPFDEAMLSWEAGPRPEDGAWAPYWYDSVWNSTGFAPPPGPLPEIKRELVPIMERAETHYETLKAHAIKLTEEGPFS